MSNIKTVVLIYSTFQRLSLKISWIMSWNFFSVTRKFILKYYFCWIFDAQKTPLIYLLTFYVTIRKLRVRGRLKLALKNSWYLPLWTSHRFSWNSKKILKKGKFFGYFTKLKKYIKERKVLWLFPFWFWQSFQEKPNGRRFFWKMW